MNHKSNNQFSRPESQLETGIAAIVAEPIDTEAIERVKAQAKSLSTNEIWQKRIGDRMRFIRFQATADLQRDPAVSKTCFGSMRSQQVWRSHLAQRYSSLEINQPLLTLSKGCVLSKAFRS